MNKHIFFIASLFLLASCSSSTTPQPTLDVNVLKQIVDEGIEVIFYGDSCTDFGLVVLPEGEYTIVFRDQVDKGTADVHVSQLRDGYTYQDLLEMQEGDPKMCNVDTDYHTLANQIDAEFDFSSGIKRVTFELEEGEHAVYVLNVKPEEIVTEQYYCFPILIIDNPSK